MKLIFSQLAGALALGFACTAGTAFAQDFDATLQDDDADDWLYAPLTSGEFVLEIEPGESLALFGDADPTHLFVLRCNKRTGEIGIARRGEAEGEVPMTIRTESRSRTFMSRQVPGYGLIAVSLPSRDPLFDAIAVTKGRFAVEVQGHETLYIPPWGEAIRVIEDCR